MATIYIGKIKPVFKGTYDNSTAYVLDDIVYYNGSSYVAKTSTTGNLPTDTTKWNILASGSGGIWDSSLSIGTANQLLRVNSGATGLEFHTPATVTSDFVRIANLNLTSGNKASFDNVFSSSDGYQSYKCIIHRYKPNAERWLKFKWRNGGSDLTNNYKVRIDGFRRQGGGSNSQDVYSYDSYSYGFVTFWSQRTDGSGIVDIDLGNPSVSLNGHTVKSTATTYESNNGILLQNAVNVRENTASYDGFCIELSNTGNSFTNLDISVYGIK